MNLFNMSTFSCTNYLLLFGGLQLRGLQCQLQLLGEFLLHRMLRDGLLGWLEKGWHRLF